MLAARKPERAWASTGRDQNIAGLEGTTLNGERVVIAEAGRAMEGVDSLLDATCFEPLRYGIGEGAFEGDQLLPINVQFAHNAMFMHSARPIDRLSAAHQRFLGIAAAQRAGSAQAEMINHHARAA